MSEEREGGLVAEAHKRCSDLRNRILRSTIKPKDTIVRLINSEISFLQRLSISQSLPSALSLNIGHLEAVVHILQHPSITGVSRVCKSIEFSPNKSIYVDIVCSLNGNPAWFIVSDRNPRYISWDGKDNKNKGGLKNKIQQVVDAASRSPPTLRPYSIVLFFSNGLENIVYENLRGEFGGTDLELDLFSYEELDVEYEWTNLVIGRSFSHACVVEVRVDKNDKNVSDYARMDRVASCSECSDVIILGSSLCSMISEMRCWCCCLVDSEPANLINFDTTAMVAIVSGISNGGTERVLGTPESELRRRFKGNYEFVIAQVHSEIEKPIHSELSVAVSEKRGIICGTVHSEFQELISMCGGTNEKLRATCFMKWLRVVPDCPSTRLMSLPTTRKLALKNKLAFGTGDYWHAPTVTANMAFIRAVSQTGMSLPVVEHNPRALIGE